MKRQNYILKIDNPCHQDWNSMYKISNGKFCSYCSKTVIDFTSLTDNKIIQIVDQKSDKICGRLNEVQLNRLIENKQLENRSILYKTLTGLFLLGTTINSFAKNNPFSKQSSRIEIVSVIDTKLNTSYQKKQKKEPVLDSLKNIIEGKVIDSKSKEPLPGVNILIKNSKTETITNLDGNFKLIIPDNLLTNKIHIIISYIGYENTETIIDKSELPKTKDLFIIKAQQALLGEVVVIKNKRWWQFWKSKKFKY
ncbi:carboxypeptidase-like regulatory domain-containing protein [Flavobacterium sufflavum]|uniref:Carboxypeptidase-like regulatory domain-containing protein n=1 Tax=Flavobacterium sufflavum TaxID=1921138 RepID=A0A3S2U6J3_9FLAO|nr:carboxypeptidase-like regulatory domain-containing protein [Flavobacterium sufflavum]RVT79981.1 carboxypeptidase-like regulatory domain-containing protein [Flavobacterium sufflavum]